MLTRLKPIFRNIAANVEQRYKNGKYKFHKSVYQLTSVAYTLFDNMIIVISDFKICLGSIRCSTFFHTCDLDLDLFGDDFPSQSLDWCKKQLTQNVTTIKNTKT